MDSRPGRVGAHEQRDDICETRYKATRRLTIRLRYFTRSRETEPSINRINSLRPRLSQRQHTSVRQKNIIDRYHTDDSNNGSYSAQRVGGGEVWYSSALGQQPLVLILLIISTRRQFSASFPYYQPIFYRSPEFTTNMRILIPLILTVISRCVASALLISPELHTRAMDDMTANRTCRWTNCGEPCPTDSMPVPRNGSQTGEMMWDHTHCPDGKSSMTFCCPTCQRAPVCTWREHKNSGKCSPGCNKGEAEVWTLGIGCKTGSISAYQNCRWEGCQKVVNKDQKMCDAEYSTLAFVAPCGFGGEGSCKNGESDL